MSKIKSPSGKHHYNNCYRQDLPKNTENWAKFENRDICTVSKNLPKIPCNYKEKNGDFTSREI